MSQDFPKEYWAARTIVYRVILAFVLVVLVSGMLVIAGIIIPPPYSDLIYSLGVVLFLGNLAVPGIAIWKSPCFAQGWLSVYNKRLYASVPWGKLNDLNKTLIYFVSISGLILVVVLLSLYILKTIGG
jgi:hypothetical protein